MSALTETQIKLPTHWASALINGDRTGLTDDEELELDYYLNNNPEHNNPVGVSEESELGHFDFNGKTLLTDLSTYKFLEQV